MADPPGSGVADRSAARALGELWGGVHPDLETLVRRDVVATLARCEPHAAGVRTHPLGPAVLAGVEEAAGPEAAQRARRALDRGLRAAQVASRLGPGGACGLTEDLLGHLFDVDATLLAALGADLRAHPLEHRGLRALWRRLRKVAQRLEMPAPKEAAPRLEVPLWERTRRLAERLGSCLAELCGPGVRLYVGPEDLPALFGARALRDLTSPPVVPDGADPPAVPESPEQRPARGDPRPLVPVVRRLWAWGREWAPRLTPYWQERLLLPP